MTKKLCFSLPLNNGIDLEEKISNAVESNADEFMEVMEAEIKTDDSRTTILGDSLEVIEIELFQSNNGVVHTQFSADFYAGCKDINSLAQHYLTYEFTYDEESLRFEIEVPIEWVIKD